MRGFLIRPQQNKTSLVPKEGATIAFRALSPQNAEELEKDYRQSLDRGLSPDIFSEYFFVGAEGEEPIKTKADDDLRNALDLVKLKVSILS